MTKLYSILLLSCASLFSSAVQSQNFTNRGTDFWVGYQSTGGLATSMKLYISTLSTGDSVTVTVLEGTPNQWKKTYWVAPNTTVVSDNIPVSGANDARLITEGLHLKKGIHVTSRGVPVSVYTHIYGSASSGSTMLLPVTVMGSEHHILNITQNYGAANYSVFHVVATSDSTWIEINPSQPTQGGWTPNGGTQPNGSYLVKLSKGDAYQVLASSLTTDLTGSTVISVPNNVGEVKPIAVFGGSTRTSLSCSSGGGSGGDLMIGQVFPYQLWAKKFATAPFSNSNSVSVLVPTVYRVMVKDPTTVVKKNGVILTGMSPARFYQFESSTADLITSDKPIMVAQYMTGACGSGLGDPEMIYISPLSEAIPRTAFYRTTNQSIASNFVTLIIPTVGLGSLKIDGVAFGSSSSIHSYPHPNLPGYSVAIKQWGATNAIVRVESNYAFIGVTYGMGSVESYGYNIGAQFDSTNLLEVPYNTITASLFLDRNKNGVQDAGEPLYNNARLQTTRAGIDTFSTQSSTGIFTVHTDTGTYISKVIPFSNYYSAVPASKTSIFPTYQNVDSISFALQAASSIRDMFVKLTATSPARPGFNATYRINYGNNGTDTADVEVALAKSNKLNFVSATVTPTSITADTLKWNFSALKPGDKGLIDVKFTLSPPPALMLNDTLKFTALISSNVADTTAADNSFKLRQRIIGSYDPNDKRESHDGQILRSAIITGEELNYTIRFQNTGTDTAFNIVITDTLDSKLDWNSLKMHSASHTYQLTVNDGIANWTFNDILLVDSNRNEPLSHGYVSFSIMPLASVAVGDVIQNKASIYFDHNLPVITNTESTTITEATLPVTLLYFNAVKQNNKNVLQWSISQQTNFSHFEVERSEDGRNFISIGRINYSQATYMFADNNYRRTLNYYRLRIVDKDGKYVYSPVRKIDNTSGVSISIYPNPAKETLQLKFESDEAKTVQLQVMSLDGKLLITQKTSITAGQNIKPINVSALQSGTYLLKISYGENEITVMKFEKQ